MDDETRACLGTLQNWIDALRSAEGFYPGAEGFRIGSTRLFEKLVSHAEHDDEYHLHQRDEDGTESDLTGARSLQGIPVSSTAPTTTQILGYNATTNAWTPTAAGSAAAHAAQHQNGGADEISVAALSGLLADDQHVLDAEAISAVEGEATLDLTGDVTIAATKSLAVDTIGEKTGAAGVTIDSVLLKDGVVAVGDVAFDDGTSDPLAVADAASDGTENSVARKDHVHPLGGTAGGDLGGSYPNPSVDDGADSTALHDNVANEITAIDTKATPVAADELVIEDSAASFVKKAVTFAALEGALTHDSLVAGTIADHDTGATGAELDTLTDGSTAGGLHVHVEAEITDLDHLTGAEAISAVEGEATLDLAGDVTIAGDKSLLVDVINEKDAHDGVTIDDTKIKDNVIYPDSGDADVAIGISGGDLGLFGDVTDADFLKFDTSEDEWLFYLANTIKLEVNTAGIAVTGVVDIDSAPADDTATGITTTRTAGTNLVWGDFCYVGADGKMEKALATAEATSRVVAFCTETVNEDATGTFLLQGFIRDDDGLEYTTIGDKVYLSDDTAGAADLTQPAAENYAIVILGIAVDTWVLYFNPSTQAIVEHVAT